MNSTAGTALQLGSWVCQSRHFRTEWFQAWSQAMGNGASLANHSDSTESRNAWGRVFNGKTKHRKMWEWCAISQSLAERGYLSEGKKGMGFAVGLEPLPSLFAAQGVQVIASDLVSAENAALWGDTGQLGDSLQAIRWPDIVKENDFFNRVQFQNVDMNNLAGLPLQSLDFLWSSCAFEHLGSLHKGLEFVWNAMDLLKPGGIAVHTTEFNTTSNQNTVETGDSVIYRQIDIEEFNRNLRIKSCAIENLCFDAGSENDDLAFDYEPFYTHGREHVKLHLLGHVTTSILLIIRKAA